MDVPDIVQNSAVLHLTRPDLFKLGFQHVTVIGFVSPDFLILYVALINTMKEYGTYCTNQTWWVDKTPEMFAGILRNPFRIFGKILGHVHPLLRSFWDVWLFHMVTTSDGFRQILATKCLMIPKLETSYPSYSKIASGRCSMKEKRI